MPHLSVRDRITIGQQWRRRRDKRTARVRQVHRADRLVELVLTDWPAADRQPPQFVSFSELRSKWQPVEPINDHAASGAKAG